MFFLYHRRSAPTGSVLAEALGLPHGDSPPMTLTYDTLIRWGNRTPINERGRVLNTAQAIARASDKYGSLEILADNGVPVPEFSTDPTELEYPFLGRRRQHARGTDIVLCLQRRDYLLRPRDYYVAYIPTSREYRVHVVGDEVIRVQGKYLDERELYAPHIRNHAHGYRFRAPRKRLRPQRLEDCVKAVQALGLDFGAVDLIVAEDGTHYILEVNTSPACSPRTGAAYVQAFASMLGLEGVDVSVLDILSPDQEEGDTEDYVPGEEIVEQEGEMLHV